MKHLVAILFLIPTLAFGAFTEFYCQSGGSNLNAGNTTSNTAAYTSTNGGYSTVTRIFTPTDGSTPSSSVSVGDLVSIYLDAATVAVFIARVTAVAAGVNGGITVDAAANAGSPPSTGASGRSLKAGGAWLGPSGSVVFPFTAINFGNLTGNVPRLNIKNDHTYSITASLGGPTGFEWVQGYSSTPGDGGRATFDGGTTAMIILNPAGVTMSWIADLIFKSSATTGTNQVIGNLGSTTKLYRVTATGGRGSGFQSSGTSGKFIECEAYDNNKSNTAGNAGFLTSVSSMSFYRCIASGNSGSNTDGFRCQTGTDIRLNQCVSFNNGRHGFALSANTGAIQEISNCDAYNNGGDGLSNLLTTVTSQAIIENCNFIKNTGYGINSALTTGTWNGIVNNCAFGAGTMANGSGTTNNTDNLIFSGTVNYASNITPYVNPSTGNFSLTNTSTVLALGTGRGAFTETQGGFSGTVGYPDIGAAQHNDTCGNTGPCRTSYGFAY